MTENASSVCLTPYSYVKGNATDTKGKMMKLNIEQEIINLKALIKEREAEEFEKYKLILMRKHLYTPSIKVSLSEEVQHS